MPLPPGCSAASARPGVEASVAITGTSLAGLLELWLGKRAIPFAAALGYVSYQTGAFCSGGPPSLPTIDAQDWADWGLLSLGLPATRPDALQRLQDTVGHFAWYEFCQCTGTATPAPVPLPPPAGAPQTNFTQGPPSTGACIDLVQGVDMHDATYVDPIVGDPRNEVNLTERFFSSGTLTTVVDPIWVGHPTVTALLLPQPLPKNIIGELTNPSITTPTTLYSIGIRTYDSTGAVVQAYGQLDAALSDGTPEAGTIQTFGATAHRMVLWAEQSQVGTPGTFTAHVTLNCAAGGPIASECCPPDQYSQTLLLKILTTLEHLNTSTSAPPSSWRDGVRHTGLGDHGHFTLAPGAVGVRAEVTNLPVTSPPHPGDPTYYYNLGFITPMAIDVPLRGQRLLFNPQSFALPQFADGIAYTFLHGARADLVEQLPVTP